MRIRAARANSSTLCNLFNPCNSFNSFGCGSAALCQSVSIGVHPWLIPLARACVFPLAAVFWIRCVDVAGGQTRGLEPRAGYIPGCAEPFYGTMAGPWWYHTATSVSRVRNLPFSALRLLIQLTRKPPSCRPCKDRTASYSAFCLLPSSFMWPPPYLHHTASIPPPYRLACCKAPLRFENRRNSGHSLLPSSFIILPSAFPQAPSMRH